MIYFNTETRQFSSIEDREFGILSKAALGAAGGGAVAAASGGITAPVAVPIGAAIGAASGIADKIHAHRRRKANQEFIKEMAGDYKERSKRGTDRQSLRNEDKKDKRLYRIKMKGTEGYLDRAGNRRLEDHRIINENIHDERDYDLKNKMHRREHRPISELISHIKH